MSAPNVVRTVLLRLENANLTKHVLERTVGSSSRETAEKSGAWQDASDGWPQHMHRTGSARFLAPACALKPAASRAVLSAHKCQDEFAIIHLQHSLLLLARYSAYLDRQCFGGQPQEKPYVTRNSMAIAECVMSSSVSAQRSMDSICCL